MVHDTKSSCILIIFPTIVFGTKNVFFFFLLNFRAYFGVQTIQEVMRRIEKANNLTSGEFNTIFLNTDIEVKSRHALY